MSGLVMSPEELLQDTLDAADEPRLRVGHDEGAPIFARENQFAYNAFGMQSEAFVPESVALTLAAEATRLRAALESIAALQTEEPAAMVWDDPGIKVGDIVSARAFALYEAASMARKALVSK